MNSIGTIANLQSNLSKSSKRKTALQQSVSIKENSLNDRNKKLKSFDIENNVHKETKKVLLQIASSLETFSVAMEDLGLDDTQPQQTVSADASEAPSDVTKIKDT